MKGKKNKLKLFFGWCLGVTCHDLVSAYFPDGGHIAGLHAYYFALPLAVLSGVALLFHGWGKEQGW